MSLSEEGSRLKLKLLSFLELVDLTDLLGDSIILAIAVILALLCLSSLPPAALTPAMVLPIVLGSSCLKSRRITEGGCIPELTDRPPPILDPMFIGLFIGDNAPMGECGYI
mmetsp:Transcript_3578/g.7450  ORF Transcript_3578/g.7450 Transcript_3578/m.7450 type:complete len:111 (-) Transcript_3578:442-774(-)